MKVLITGGTGTISSGLVQESVNRGFETYAITRGNNNRRNISGVHYFQADIWNEKSVKSAIGDLKFDVVVECLAYSVNQLKKSLENFADRCGQFVFISTAGVYNRIGEKRIKESNPKEFILWDYTKFKIECENYLRNYSEKTGIKYTIVRPTVTYGDYRVPFPIATRNPGWTFFDRMKSGQLMLAADNVKFSIIHISDFSKMVVSLFSNEKAINEDFHITSDHNDIMWDDVIKESGELLGVEPKIIHVSNDVIKKIWPEIYAEIKYHKNTSQIFDSSKIKGVTKIEAQIDLKSGMTKVVSAMKSEFYNNNLLLDDNWNYHCDAAILYAYRNNLLSSEETSIVSDYFNVYGSERMEKGLRLVMRNNSKSRMKQLISKGKKNIKGIIGK